MSEPQIICQDCGNLLKEACFSCLTEDLFPDNARLDWLEKQGTEIYESIRWHLINEGGTLREAIDFFKNRRGE